mmetsp:Transcript_8960/g.7967  ORF Transcript_8960/g.7967 Transcript_8960/m.7967 type:complete len:90 (+) Transcript_8960:3-272(+)
MNIKDDGALPVPKDDDNDNIDLDKGDDDTNNSADDNVEEEKEAMEFEEKKRVFSDKQWKLIVSFLGTGLILVLIILTLNLVNTLLKSEG